MSRPSADASRSDEQVRQRIAELNAQIALLTLERERSAQAERDLRLQENQAARISFATEIFEARQAQLRLRVEIELLQKKIRRLELGYAENPTPDQSPSGGFLF